MRTTKTLKPGEDGTKGLLTRFGRDLLRVRYRYDEDRREHLKTVELVVERRSRQGEAECPGSRTPADRALAGRRPAVPAGGLASRRVALRIDWWERGLQQRVKSAGGRWDPDRKVWMLRRDVAERLDLMGRGRWRFLDLGSSGDEVARCGKVRRHEERAVLSEHVKE